MNKQQIKAELRRSACEDEDPYDGVAYDAFHEVLWKWCGQGEAFWPKDIELNRILFLLVAAAL